MLLSYHYLMRQDQPLIKQLNSNELFFFCKKKFLSSLFSHPSPYIGVKASQKKFFKSFGSINNEVLSDE